MARISLPSDALLWTSDRSPPGELRRFERIERDGVVARLVAGPDERELWLPIFAHVRQLLTAPHRIDRVIPREAHGYR